MNLSEALNQSKGMTITDLTVRITKAFPTKEGDGWSRMDLRGEDTTMKDAVIKLWNPAVTPEQLMGKTVTISATPNARNQWTGAKTEVWTKQDGTVEAQVSVDGTNLSLYGETAAPVAPIVPAEVQVNADVQGPPPGWEPVAQPAQTTHPPTAAAPGSAKDLCQLLADLHLDIANRLDTAREPNAMVSDQAFAEAGTHARTLFIQLAKEGKLDAAAKEFDLPF